MARETAAAPTNKPPKNDRTTNEAEALLKGFLKALLLEQSPHYSPASGAQAADAQAAEDEDLARG